MDAGDERVRLAHAAGRPGRRRGAVRLPARAADLSGLPTAYVDTGSAEVFRDEDVAYASALWAAGGQANCMWAGGHHGFDAQFRGRSCR